MSDLLLDTQVFLWMNAEPEKLGHARERLLDPAGNLFLSAASSWEIAIKYSLGKLVLPEVPARYVPSRMRLTGVDRMPLEHAHVLQVASLPHHHRDPFDRALIAQAMIEGLMLVTADPVFRLYTDDVIMV